MRNTGGQERSLNWKFLRSEEGATAIEFAIVSLPLFALLLFMLQAVIIYFADAALETFCDDQARGLLTGNTQNLALTPSAFQLKICGSLPSLFSCGRLWVDVENAANFANANVAAPTVSVDGSGNVTSPWGYNPGAQGAVVVMRMVYMWPVVNIPIGTIANLGGTIHHISATSVFKAEPYQ